MASLLNSFDQIIYRDRPAGQKHSDCITDIVDGNNTSSVVIPYGAIVVIDDSVTATNDVNNPPVKLISADDEVIVGLSVLEYTNEEARNVAEANGFPPTSQFPIAKKGEFKVFSETANKYGDPVFVRYATGAGGTKVGYGFRNATVANEAVAVPNAIWVTANGAGKVGAIRLNS